MSYFIRKLDNIEPVDAVVDVLEKLPGLHNDMPSIIGFQYWVSAPGGGGAGAYSVSVAYVDPTGVERVIPGAPISLQDAEGIYTSPVQIIERQSDVSLFEIREDINGSADGATVSYRVFFSNPNSEEASFFNN